jgi:hypothetical protein
MSPSEGAGVVDEGATRRASVMAKLLSIPLASQFLSQKQHPRFRSPFGHGEVCHT